jgi:hypothetical protein
MRRLTASRRLKKQWTITVPSPFYWGLVYFYRCFHLREIVGDYFDRRRFYRAVREWLPPSDPNDCNSVRELQDYERLTRLGRRVF